MAGKGAGTAASTCNPFSGTGTLNGAGSKIVVKVVSSSKTQACAANSAAPTPVIVNGVATIVSGTGKFKGANGTLTFKGSFSIQSHHRGFHRERLVQRDAHRHASTVKKFPINPT